MAHLAPTQRPLRLLATLALAAAMLASPVVADEGDAPRSFKVEEPRLGDEWTYAVHHLNQSADGWTPAPIEGTRLLQRSFTQASASNVYDQDGNGVGVASLFEERILGDAENAWSEQFSYGVDATGATRSTTWVHEGLGASGVGSIEGLPGNNSLLESDLAYPLLATTTFDGNPFCGHRSVLQGRSVVLSGGVRLDGCGSEARFVPVASATWSDTKAVVLGLETDPASLQVWFVADRPVPVRVLDARSDPAVLLEMTSFTAGSTPLEYGSGKLVALPSVVAAPREAFGPSEAGVDHPFPLSAAYAAALAVDGSELASFLSSHPGAYPASAAYTDVRDEKHTHVEHRRSWTLTVSDGAAAETARVTHTAIERAGLPVPVPMDALPPTVEFLTPSAGPFPTPANVSADWPTVASLLARWEASSSAGQEGNSWGFTVGCAVDCNASVVNFRAGWDDTYIANEAEVTYGSATIPEHNADLLAVDGTGRTTWAETTTYTEEHFLMVGPFVSGEPPQDVEAVEVSTIPSDPQVPWTGLAIAGTAVGLAVVIALLAKAGLFGGLFSRHIEDVSAHPVRRTLIDAIQAQPGIHYSELLRRTGKGNSVVGHHLRRLVASNLVVVKQGPRFQCYFPAGTSRATLAAGPLLKSPVAQGILSAAAAHPIAGQELAAKLGVAPGAISFHAQRLTQAGLLTSRRQGRYVYLEATVAGKESVLDA